MNKINKVPKKLEKKHNCLLLQFISNFFGVVLGKLAIPTESYPSSLFKHFQKGPHKSSEQKIKTSTSLQEK